MDPTYQLWFAVRFLHMASATLLAGGALIIAAWCLAPRAGGDAGAVHAVTPFYEWIFWSLIGLVVATGVSNLGLKGDGLMGPATGWGTALTTKIGVVAVLLALSLVRSDFVIRCAAAVEGGLPARARSILGALYALTVVFFLGALWLGLGLAHGRY